MISPKRLIKLAKKWQKLAAAKRLRILGSSVASEGHFVVYTSDEKRFMIPLELLSQNVFVELLRLSEEEFGLPSDGPITLPCDCVFLEYAISLVRRCINGDVEKVLLTSIAPCHYAASSSSSSSSSSSLGKCHPHHTLIYGF